MMNFKSRKNRKRRRSNRITRMNLGNGIHSVSSIEKNRRKAVALRNTRSFISDYC